jgi:hypothetical protein
MTDKKALIALGSSHRQYRFEVAVITINFISLIISAILLSRLFKQIKT